MLKNQMPADELALIRKEIRALRNREVELRKCFTEECDSGRFEGCEYDVEVRLQRRRVLAKHRLPPQILNDPQYFEIRTSPIVRIIPRDEPRLPLDYTANGPVEGLENADVIEAW